MGETQTLEWLFGGVFLALAFASLVGLVLKFKIRFQPHKTIDNLVTRVNAWWLMIGILAAAMWLGKAALIVLFALISLQCLREFISLTHTRRGDHHALAWSFFFFLPLQYLLVANEWYGLFVILIPVYAFLLLPISAALGMDTARFFERTAKVQWGLMLCVYCLSHIPALMLLKIPGYPGDNFVLIVFLLLVVEASDVMQYVCGKLFGKHTLAPAISPSKTIEGLIGGIACSTLIGALLWWATPFNFWQTALVALTINIVGFFGGFVLSAIKRDRGIKDWGYLIEGHGGMLDRMDSLSFAAPIFFHILRYWWTP